MIVQFPIQCVQLVLAPGHESRCDGQVLAAAAQAAGVRYPFGGRVFLENGCYRRSKRLGIETHGFERERAGKLDEAICFFHSCSLSDCGNSGILIVNLQRSLIHRRFVSARPFRLTMPGWPHHNCPGQPSLINPGSARSVHPVKDRETHP